MNLLKTLYFLIIFYFLQIFVSCEKLIEVDVPNNQIELGHVFQDTQTANAALSGLYAGLWDSSPLSGDQTGRFLGTYVDDLDCYAITSIDGSYDLYQNKQIDSNPLIFSYWTNAYQKIYVANSIIEGVENSTSLPTLVKNRIKGEAMLIRSVLFFYMQQIFGDIPMPTTTDYKVNQSLAKTVSVEVLNKLVNDLNHVITLIPDDYRSTERIYPNRKVAQLMLAKVYMLQHKWIEAESILKNIYQSPLYQFQNDITKVFTKTSSHILWQLKPKNNGDGTKEAITYYFSGAAPNSYALSQNLMSSFSSGDLRKLNWTGTVTVGSSTWYRAEKYKNRTNNNSENSIVFRLEEVYLLLAETLIQQNKTYEALPFINATRQRAGLAALSDQYSQNQLMDELMMENRKEFFTEMGHRFFDLKRTGRLNTLVIAKPNWKDFHNLWPLPLKELQLNPNLKPQNTGY